jgi:hypothetical protein
MSRASGSDCASRSSLGHHEGVTGPAGGEGELESGPVTVRARQAVIHVDAVVGDAERAEHASLWSEIPVSVETRA